MLRVLARVGPTHRRAYDGTETMEPPPDAKFLHENNKYGNRDDRIWIAHRRAGRHPQPLRWQSQIATVPFLRTL